MELWMRDEQLWLAVHRTDPKPNVVFNCSFARRNPEYLQKKH